jgi:hypothetical protein
VVALCLLCLSTPTRALIGGMLDADNRFGAVVSLRTTAGRWCSATKIAPRAFLTAAHCVIDVPSGGLAGPFRAGGRVLVSGQAEPKGASDYLSLTVVRTQLPAAFETALGRLHAYQEGRIAELRERYSGQDLARRVRRVYADAHISPRFPDLALVQVADATPAIPMLTLDLGPLARGDAVVLVGYGCERVADLARGRQRPKAGRRTWGRSRIIRVDEVNFYTFAAQLLPGTPSLCPGDSGGPVLRAGRVVGVHGTVYGLGPTDSARSNMSVNLHSLSDWDAWPDSGRASPGR